MQSGSNIDRSLQKVATSRALHLNLYTTINSQFTDNCSKIAIENYSITKCHAVDTFQIYSRVL